MTAVQFDQPPLPKKAGGFLFRPPHLSAPAEGFGWGAKELCSQTCMEGRDHEKVF
jgi:hypothetical protein